MIYENEESNVPISHSSPRWKQDCRISYTKGEKYELSNDEQLNMKVYYSYTEKGILQKKKKKNKINKIRCLASHF